MLNEARINSLTRELEVLDAQRRGLAAELRSFGGAPGEPWLSDRQCHRLPSPFRRARHHDGDPRLHHRRAPAAESARVRGHPVPGRAAEADRERGPWAPRIDAGQRHDLARGRRTRPGAALWAASVAGGGGEETWPGPFIAPGAVWRGRAPAGAGGGEGRPPRPLSGPRTGGGTQHGPPRRADTRAGNQRDRIAVQGVAADPSASSAGRAAAVLDEPPRCREHRGARPRHRRARHA